MIQPSEAQIAQAREWISQEIHVSADEVWTDYLSEKLARDESLSAYVRQCQGFFNAPNLLRRLRVAFEDEQFALQRLPDSAPIEKSPTFASDELLNHIRNIVKSVRLERERSTTRRTGRTALQQKICLSSNDIDILDLRFGVTRGDQLEAGAIAARTGRSPRGVRSALSRAIKRIRDYYGLT